MGLLDMFKKKGNEENKVVNTGDLTNNADVKNINDQAPVPTMMQDNPFSEGQVEVPVAAVDNQPAPPTFDQVFNPSPTNLV